MVNGPQSTESPDAVLAEITSDVSMRSSMRTGVLYLGLGNALSRVLRFVAQYILIWLLVPADFGLVAMATALLNIVQAVSEFGVGVAVIQKKDMTAGYVHTAFWVNLAANLLIFATIWIAAPWIAAFYDAEEITWLVRISSFNFPIAAFRTIPISLLRKRMQFGLNSALETAWNGISGVLMILFAWFNATYWSLVIPSLLVGLLMTPLWFKYAKWRPALVFDRSQFWDLFHFSKHLVCASLLALVTSNSGFVLAGNMLGKDAAGYFSVATTYSTIVLINYAYLAGNVSLSGFAAKQGDSGALRDGFVRLYELLLATTLPIHVLGIVLAPLLFAVFIPPAFGPALVCFQLLLALAAVRSFAAHVAPLYNAVKKAHVNSYFYMVSTPLCVIAMYVACQQGFEAGGVRAGLDSLAWATTVTQSVAVFAMLALSRYLLHWQDIGLVRRAFPYICACTLAALVAYTVTLVDGYVVQGLPTRAADFVVLSLASLAGMGTYVCALYIFARSRLALLVRDALPMGFRNYVVYRWFPRLRHVEPS